MSATRIHPTALVDPTARLGVGVEVGAFAIIGPDVEIGDDAVIGARSTLVRYVRLAEGVRLGEGVHLGGPPQDTKFKGEETWVEIGAHTVIREYSTVNRATTASFRTTVGAHCFLMTYVHVAHDCHVGDHVTIANSTQMAGHVTVEDHAVISGLNAIHQFVRIGAYSFVGGGSRVNQDVPPFTKAVGSPIELYGLNSVLLQRLGFAPETMVALKRAYRIVFNSDLSLTRAVSRAREEVTMTPEVERFLAFVSNAGRGVPA
ncbi:MAG: acyl-ACP--UDP-N-acetylglucosamine O-acyltransferase [Gemmatimonadales bacterium]|jgi:UDP-N-acetylglucosamine acyltransferase|nr:acyl-ACP--UDP-N-acetylglucosamine O-acyltransferase [Gemmatimonadales bacterium]